MNHVEQNFYGFNEVPRFTNQAWLKGNVLIRLFGTWLYVTLWTPLWFWLRGQSCGSYIAYLRFDGAAVRDSKVSKISY